MNEYELPVDETRKLGRIIIVMSELCHIQGQGVSNYRKRGYSI